MLLQRPPQSLSNGPIIPENRGIWRVTQKYSSLGLVRKKFTVAISSILRHTPTMMKFDLQRAEALSKVFTAQELDWILEQLPADSTDHNQQRILDVLSEAFALSVE